MPASLSALLQSGDHPSQQLLGQPTPHRLPADIPRLATRTPTRATQGGASGGTSLLGSPSGARLPARIELEGRDPFSLWVHWHVDESGGVPGGSVRLRLFAHSLEGPWMLEQPVAASGNRTLPVLYANTVYLAALGIVSDSGAWHPLAVSAPVRTAPDKPSTAWTSRSARFESRSTRTEASTTAPVPTAGEDVASDGLPDIESASFLAALALEAVVWGADPDSSSALAIRTRPLSEAAERDGRRPITPPGSAPWPSETPSAPGSVPSHTPPPASAPGFWFRVNAELILHGSTEPGASITIGGRPVRLRDDGSFTFRFSLPDGSFDLPVEAVKADGSDRRAVDLTVTRKTVERGEVGVHPIDPSLKPPSWRP